MVTWGEFARLEPPLAAFAVERLRAAPAYLATLRRIGAPRVHPVTPILTLEGLFVFMEPTSPKGRDLRERHWYGLHSGVPDMQGTGGELFVAGKGFMVNDPTVRELVTKASTYEPADRYVLFELTVTEVRANGYGDISLPTPSRWAGDEGDVVE
jgi:hypothetical protein